jgi:translation initiation factor 1
MRKSTRLSLCFSFGSGGRRVLVRDAGNGPLRVEERGRHLEFPPQGRVRILFRKHLRGIERSRTVTDRSKRLTRTSRTVVFRSRVSVRVFDSLRKPGLERSSESGAMACPLPGMCGLLQRMIHPSGEWGYDGERTVGFGNFRGPGIIYGRGGRTSGVREGGVSGRKEEPVLVYSTERGLVCPACRLPVRKCRCRKEPPPPEGDGIVRVRRETKGRAGKTVTAVDGISLPGDALRALASELKQRCGTGGTLKDGVIEIQGDHRETVVDWLSRKGFTVKRAGG